MSIAVTPAGNERPGEGLGDGVGLGATDGFGEVAGPTAGAGREINANPTTATMSAAATRPLLAKRRTVRPMREGDSCPMPGIDTRTASTTGSTDRG